MRFRAISICSQHHRSLFRLAIEVVFVHLIVCLTGHLLLLLNQFVIGIFGEEIGLVRIRVPDCKISHLGLVG